MTKKVAIIFYSMYGHIQIMAEAEAEGVRAAGLEVDIVPETLPEEVLKAMHAPAKPDIPVASTETLSQIGIPTRYGNFPAQWKAFWDQTGGLWAKQTLAGKKFGVFVSTAVQGGGQELTAFQSLSVAIHHGMVFVPIGYQITESTDLSELHGGSPWGAGTFTGLDGARKPSALELGIAKNQGKLFGNYVQARD